MYNKYVFFCWLFIIYIRLKICKLEGYCCYIERFMLIRLENEKNVYFLKICNLIIIFIYVYVGEKFLKNFVWSS